MTIEEMEDQVSMAKNKKKKRKKKIIIFLTVLLILIATGVFTYLYLFPNNIKEEIKKKIEPEKTLEIVDLKSNQRPIAVMIDNNTGRNNNNNHAGLQESYLNYELIVEGGLTRIMAIFKDKDVNLIGPVRSSRHNFLDYSLESDALYAHFGWSTFAQHDIKSLGVDNVNGLYASIPYWRETTIAAPHNVFTSTSKLGEGAKSQNYKTESSDWKLLNYSFDEINLDKVATKTIDKTTTTDPNLTTANIVKIAYSNHQIRSYQYDSERKVYLRFMNSVAHNDKTTNEQLNYKNIIIQKVANKTLDSEGRQDLTTTGDGDGYYITNGYALPIKWTKNTRSSKTEYKYLDNTKVKFNDGNTFVQIQPNIYMPEFE